MKEEQQMSRLIPQDIETFLYELGTLQVGHTRAFEQYAKTSAALLWEKYVILKDPSIQDLLNPAKQSKPRKRKPTAPNADFLAIRRKTMGRLFGLYLKSGREKRGRSIEEVARLAGMETPEWAAIEAGNTPDPATLHSIAAALGNTISQIAPMVRICQDAWSL
jgi:hypothetical protein